MEEHFTSSYLHPRASDVSLSGRWQLGSAEEAAENPQEIAWEISAEIPDALQFSLFRAGKLPHPYMNDFSHLYKDLDRKVWYYRRIFDLPEDKLSEQAFLCFDGISYRCRVWLNGVPLGAHEGHEGGPIFRVTGLLRATGNELIAECTAATRGTDCSESVWERATKDSGIMPWSCLRDNACSNNDFTVIGIWREVRLCFLPAVHLSRPYLFTEKLEGDKALLRFRCEVPDEQTDEASLFRMGAVQEDGAQYFGAGGSFKPIRELTLRLTLTDSAGKVFEKEQPFRLPDLAEAFREVPEKNREPVTVEMKLELDKPRLWFPQGLGKPELYQAEAALLSDGEVLDRIDFTAGIRTVENDYTEGLRLNSYAEKFRFRVNGKDFFVKGMNWMPLDPLYHLTEEDYRWTVGLAARQGVQMLRVWSGGGFFETDTFYRLCDEYGILVWQDFPMANAAKPEIRLDVLTEQSELNLYRIRNHPSLAIYTGGNEVNADQAENAAAMYVEQREAKYLDPAKIYYPTSPYGGSLHIYTDKEPVWFRKGFGFVSFMAEGGIHCYPNMESLRQQVTGESLEFPASEAARPDFTERHPILANHAVENNVERVPQMVSRTSQMIPLEESSLSDFCRASQLAAGEFYQVMTEALREKYPSCGGFLPWTFRRPWLTTGIQMADGLGQPVIPYYYYRKSITPASAAWRTEELDFAPGEEIALPITLLNETGKSMVQPCLKLEIYAPSLALCLTKELSLPPIPADRYRTDADMGSFVPGSEFTDRFFLIRLRLYDGDRLLCDRHYHPKCLSCLADEVFRQDFRNEPRRNLRFSRPPYLLKQLAEGPKTDLKLSAVRTSDSRGFPTWEITVENTGSVPAFPVHFGLRHTLTQWVAEDDSFLLAPGEIRRMQFTLRSFDERQEPALTVSAQNAEPAACLLF